METNIIKLEVVVNLGNFESLRLGGEFTPSPSYDMSTNFVKADAKLREAARAILDARKNPTQEPTPAAPETKPEQEQQNNDPATVDDEKPIEPVVTGADGKPLRILHFGDKEVQTILKRLSANSTTYEEVRKWFNLTDAAFRAIAAASYLAGDKTCPWNEKDAEKYINK